MRRPVAGRRRVARSAQPSASTSLTVEKASIPDGMLERLDVLLHDMAKAEGRKGALEARLSELKDVVGKAKGRAMLKADVDDFLEELQSVVLRKAVGSYEALLTGLVDDVLETKDKIGLDLYTERGLPALDIFVDAEKGREDIMDGTGGSMTNVISFGLRIIATVRSGMRKFVALDEPDCWVAPQRVPNFYRVIRQSGSELGVQSLIISHHDLSLVPEGCSVVRFYVDNGRIHCENDPNAAKWEDDAEGIRSIRLVNFMSHEDTTIKLSPGATMIVGNNNIGKSVTLRALRAVAYGEISTADIRHGESSLEVEIEIEGGRVVKLTRQPGRNPVNEWTFEDGKGNILVDEATRTEYRTGGRSAAPDWVGKVLGIEMFEGLKHQLSHQKHPVFLLGEPASKRASVLSIGRESSFVQKMIARQKDSAKQDQSTIKSGEVEVGKIMDELARLEVYQSIKDELDSAVKASEGLDETYAVIADMERCMALSDSVETRIAANKKRFAVLKSLPEGDVDSISQVLRDRDEINSLGKRLVEVQKSISVKAKKVEAFGEGLPDAPVLPDERELASLISQMERLDRDIQTASKRKSETEAGFNEAVKALDEAFERMGGVCPLCGSSVQHTHEGAA